jgi:hypothetical protein
MVVVASFLIGNTLSLKPLWIDDDRHELNENFLGRHISLGAFLRSAD